jgi:hypothetical protein
MITMIPASHNPGLPPIHSRISFVQGSAVSFHVQVPYTNRFGWFIGSNTYFTNITTSVPLFTDPASSAIHIVN